jgi:hypothetical protein
MYAPPPVSATGSIQHVECVVDAGLRQKVRLVSSAPRLGSVTDAADRCILRAGASNARRLVSGGC